MAQQVTGTRPISVTNFLTTERLNTDRRLFMAAAYSYPFLAYMLTQGVIPAPDYHIKTHFKDKLPQHTTVNHSAGYSTTDPISVVVTDASIFRINDLVLNFTSKERYRVTAATISTNTVQLARALGTTVAANLVDGDYLIRLNPGSRHGEGVGDVATTAPVLSNHYVQEFQKLVRFNKENRNVQTIVGGDRKMIERAVQLNELWLDVDKALMLNEGAVHVSGKGTGSTGSAAGLDTSTDHPLYISNGIKGLASTYVFDNHASSGARATITESAFDDMLVAYVHPEAQGQLLPLFCSQAFFSALTFWGRAKLQYGPSDLVHGISVNKYQGSAGPVELFLEPNLKDYATSVGWNGCAFSVVPGQVFAMTVPGETIELEPDIVKDGTRQDVDRWVGGYGLFATHEKYMCWISGISGGV